MSSLTASAICLLLGLALAAPAPNPVPLAIRDLNPSCAPGGNFDLSKFTLQLPIGSDKKPDQITADKLSGCDGWQNDKFFYTSSDGALVMKVPGSPDSAGCVTTSGSKHCRTELRENSPKSWSPNAPVNRLRASLKVVKADYSKYGTVVGQILSPKKPVCELFINKKGVITMGVSQIPNVSSLEYNEVGKVAIGEQFTYEIRYEKNKLSVAINGKEFQFLSTGSLQSPASYFKAGNYNQGDSPNEVHFYSIDIKHSGS